MNPPKVDFLHATGNQSLEPSGPRRPGRLFYLFIVGMVFAGSFGLGRLSLSETAAAALARLDGIPIFHQMHLIASPDRQLAGEEDDRVNILMLGMGGEGHDGPMLTDTIMVASIRPMDSQVALLSIPRDLLVPLEGHGWRKINAANAFGELQKKGSGPELARQTIESLLGIEIPYYVRVDFNGFKKIIDDVGGLDVQVERSFTDYAYPNRYYGYQTVRFEEGWQRLDSEQALQYARSRHGNNGEGSDFARAKRQQKVLMALKEQLLTLRLLKDPGKITAILANLNENISTNLQLGEILRLAKIGRAVDPGKIIHKVIGDGPESPIRSAMVNSAYVLLPKNGDWDQLRDVAQGLFDESSDINLKPARAAGTAADEGSQPDKKATETSDITLEILNGTGRTGLARTTANKLKGFGYQIREIGNASSNDRQTTTIYDLTGGNLTESIETLQTYLGVSDPAVEVSQSSISRGPKSADLLIILGHDIPAS